MFAAPKCVGGRRRRVSPGGLIPRIVVDDERGVLLLTALAVMVILGILLGALALATMNEIAISRQQASAAQAFFLAEAGAYRGLTELRHRLSVDFGNNIAQARPEDLILACEADQPWRLVARFAHAGKESDWVEDPATGQAMLALNGGEPIVIRAPGGQEIGRFTVTIRVGSANQYAKRECARGGPTEPETYRMYVTYEIGAEGAARNGRRVIRLSNARDAPVELLVERASFSRWALLLLEDSEAWLTDDAVINGPAHTNGRWWIWGHPVFAGPVSSVDRTVRFGNCGNPIELEAGTNPGRWGCGGDHPKYLSGELQRGTPRVEFPTLPVNPARVSLGLEPVGPDPLDEEIRTAAADQVPSASKSDVAEGIYLSNDGEVLRHPRTLRATGVYVKGDVKELAFLVEDGRQALIIQLAGSGDAQTVKKVVLDRQDESTEIRWGPDFTTVKSYRGLPNGVIYVEGEIESLSGVIEDGQFTVAAREAITVTDHLVYRMPPFPRGGLPSLNILGLYSRDGDVQVDLAAASEDLYIDASILAPQGQVKVLEADEDPTTRKRAVRVFGGIIQQEFGQLDSSHPTRQAWSGQNLVFRYDQRLLDQVAPPFFPRTEHYAARRRYPDALYLKPVWQEGVR